MSDLITADQQTESVQLTDLPVDVYFIIIGLLLRQEQKDQTISSLLQTSKQVRQLTITVLQTAKQLSFKLDLKSVYMILQHCKNLWTIQLKFKPKQINAKQLTKLLRACIQHQMKLNEIKLFVPTICTGDMKLLPNNLKMLMISDTTMFGASKISGRLISGLNQQVQQSLTSLQLCSGRYQTSHLDQIANLLNLKVLKIHVKVLIKLDWLTKLAQLEQLYLNVSLIHSKLVQFSLKHPKLRILFFEFEVCNYLEFIDADSSLLQEFTLDSIEDLEDEYIDPSFVAQMSHLVTFRLLRGLETGELLSNLLLCPQFKQLRVPMFTFEYAVQECLDQLQFSNSDRTIEIGWLAGPFWPVNLTTNKDELVKEFNREFDNIDRKHYSDYTHHFYPQY